MGLRLSSARGFSLTELMVVVAFATGLMAISLPILTDITQTTKLNEAARLVERELQNARLKAVNVNRPLRVRLNCPAVGYLRTVEVVGTAVDTASDRCLLTAYPFPASDTDVMTKPNFDGPMRIMPLGAAVTTQDLEFEPDGTTYSLVSGALQVIATPVTITVSRNGRTKAITVNGAGKIQLQ
jgi:prepilin-type N-terminal cleavage/methylation domain-containing protein